MKKGQSSLLPLQPAAASYLPLVSEEGEYCIALFFMFSVNPGGEITEPGDRRLWQMENLSKGIMMPPDLLSFPFLLEPRYHWSVSDDVVGSDGGAPVPRRASLRGGWNSPWWPLHLCHSQLSGRHNDIVVTFEMHPAGPCYCCQPDYKKVLSVPRSRWPLSRESLRRPLFYWAIEGFQQI